MNLDLIYLIEQCCFFTEYESLLSSLHIFEFYSEEKCQENKRLYAQMLPSGKINANSPFRWALQWAEADMQAVIFTTVTRYSCSI